MTPNRVAEIIEAAFAEGFGAGLLASLKEGPWTDLDKRHNEFWAQSKCKSLHDALVLRSHPAEGSA